MSKTIKPYRNKGECLQTEPSDLQGICKFAIESLQRNNGRNAKYGNDEQERQRFLDDCVEYFNYLYDGNVGKDQEQMLIPSVESLCLFLGLTRTTLFNYCKRSPEWNETVNMVRNAIATARVELASHYKIPPLVHLFDLCNNHPQYHNTSEFKISAEPKQETETPRISMSELTAISEMPEMPQ